MKAFARLMPAHNELIDVITQHVTSERAGDYAGPGSALPSARTVPVASELETLRGKPRLIAIARNDPSLAIALDHLLDLLVEADFARACETSEELSHRIRTHYLASRSDREGVAK